MSDTKQIAPLKLILEGRFWDSHVYMGKLYLFTIDGRVHTIEWDRLISEFPLPDELALPMQCAFSRSDYLYENRHDPLHQDPQVRELIQAKFMRLANHHKIPRAADWRKYLVHTKDSPFPFPHLDATIYMKGVFAVSEQGVFVISNNDLQSKSKSKRGKSGRALQMWDCPVLSVDASYGSLALAAGPEGLFEFELDDWVRGDPRKAKQVDPGDCSDCSWAYYSIMGSSQKQGGIFAEYVARGNGDGADVNQGRRASKGKNKGPKEFEPTNLGRSWREAPKIERRFEKARSPKDIFNFNPSGSGSASGYCWGGMDKICHASEGTMTVARYHPWKDEPERLRVLRRLTFDSQKGSPIGGAVAPFGSIIEMDKYIVVVRSDDEIFTIPGAPVNWRVFNRSKQYENQLHVIHENRLEIYSFNHDYFVDQKQKFSGISAFV